MGTAPEVEKKAIILFDGFCNLCNGAVNFIIDRDPTAQFKFASLQSSFGEKVLKNHGLDPKNLETMILLKGEAIFHRSEAALLIAQMLSGPWKIFSIFRIIPSGLRDPVYNWIAANRYSWFGRRNECRVPSPELQDRFLD